MYIQYIFLTKELCNFLDEDGYEDTADTWNIPSCHFFTLQSSHIATVLWWCMAPLPRTTSWFAGMVRCYSPFNLADLVETGFPKKNNSCYWTYPVTMEPLNWTLLVGKERHIQSQAEAINSKEYRQTKTVKPDVSSVNYHRLVSRFFPATLVGQVFS